MSPSSLQTDHVQSKSKAQLAADFGCSVKTLMRWLKQWNETLPDKLNLRSNLFSPRDARRIIEQFG